MCRRYLKYRATRITLICEILVIEGKMAVKAYKDAAHLLELLMMEDMPYKSFLGVNLVLNNVTKIHT